MIATWWLARCTIVLVPIFIARRYDTIIHSIQGAICENSPDGNHPSSSSPLVSLAHQPEPTLVVYVFSGSDPEYADNLRYFLRTAPHANDGCDYIIVLQQHPTGWPNPSLPGDLPTNVRVLHHPNECFDLGTVGWVLQTHVDISRYTFFLWLNSSVRGPFMPSYLRGHMHWTRPFTDKLTPSTKLVGATINCGGAHGTAPKPHVQSYVVATDRAGLSVLLAAPGVFECWKEMADVVVHSEIGASVAILNAGFNIDSLMLRYQGLDWRDPRLSGEAEFPCNAGMNPLQPGFNDGIDVHPLETMFVKVKRSHLEAGWPHADAGRVMSRWSDAAMHVGGVTDGASEKALVDAVRRNAWLNGKAVEVEADALRRGKACFDVAFYLDANAYDLGFIRELDDFEGAAWEQFIDMGLFEGRPHRWTC
jgi:hypothetical protein